MNKYRAKKHCFYLILLIAVSLAGCIADSNQFFLPGVSSGEEANKSVFVPAVQSDDSGESVETQAAPVATAPSEPTVDASMEESSGGTADADVLFVKAHRSEPGKWTFSVTVAHPDTGWDDYADGWDVILPDGIVVKPIDDSPFTRLLLHPHVEEQPFTRSQSNIEIPEDVEWVTVRAHDLLDGFGGEEILVDLTVEEGTGFEVQRN